MTTPAVSIFESMPGTIPWFLLEKRTRDAINRISRELAGRHTVSVSDVADELRRKRPDIAREWGDLNAIVATHLRRRFDPCCRTHWKRR
jgi:hypothetical protein